jgi:hypothetical protein
MTTNHDPIVSDFMTKCEALYRFVTQRNAGVTAYEVEAHIFQEVLQIGKLAMHAYLDTQSPFYRHSTTEDAKGDILPRKEERSGLYYSIFGTVTYTRSYYWRDGHGFYPMDAALNLPPTGRSDFLRTFVEEFAIDMSYNDTTTKFARYFPIAISTRAIVDEIAVDSEDAESFYAQAPAPPVCPEATILAVEADGKGIPMRKAAVAETLPGQAKAGCKRNGKTKEATVVSVSTHIPYYRTAEQVRDSLFRERAADGAEHGDGREKPACKRTWASIEGKREALAQVKVWTKQMVCEYIKHRIALVDGAVALQNRVREECPDYELILDIIHAAGYVWSAADAKFGKGTKEGWNWTYNSILTILVGKVCDVISELDSWADTMNDNDPRWKPIETSANYFERNQDAMKYGEYLAKGWPIATGIIEGACRHVVKDRCERSGMMWTEQGVQAFLQLRCVHVNGDWAAYHQFRMRRRHERAYGAKLNQANGLIDSDVCGFVRKSDYAMAI